MTYYLVLDFKEDDLDFDGVVVGLLVNGDSIKAVFDKLVEIVSGKDKYKAVYTIMQLITKQKVGIPTDCMMMKPIDTEACKHAYRVDYVYRDDLVKVHVGCNCMTKAVYSFELEEFKLVNRDTQEELIRLIDNTCMISSDKIIEETENISKYMDLSAEI